MTETGESRPYEEVRALVEQIGGTMTFRPMGRGGDWILDLHGKTAVVGCRDRRVNALDYCYVAKVSTPTTWADYEPDAPLRADAFWTVIDLVRSEMRDA